MSDHAINLVLLVCAVISAPCEVAIGYVVIQEYRRDSEPATESGQQTRVRRPFRHWLALSILSLGPLIALGLAYLAFAGWIEVGTRTIEGTADVPAAVDHVTIPVPASLPYTVHYKTDWTTGNDNIARKQDGQFTIWFGYGPPPGGGSIDWQVTPRSKSGTVASADTPTVTPSPTPVPKPWQTFIQGGEAGQRFAQQIQQNPIPGPHTVDIIATDASHAFAMSTVGWLQGHWAIITHGQPDALIGEPSEYSLDDGITIRARASNADAETLRLAFLVSGLNVRRVVLPDSDNRPYPILEIGNIPPDQR